MFVVAITFTKKEFVSRFLNKIISFWNCWSPSDNSDKRLTGASDRSSFMTSTQWTTSKKSLFTFTQRFTQSKSLFDTAQLSATLNFEVLLRIWFRFVDKQSFRFYNFNSIDCELECFFSFLLPRCRLKRLSLSCRVFCHLILDTARRGTCVGFPWLSRANFSI